MYEWNTGMFVCEEGRCVPLFTQCSIVCCIQIRKWMKEPSRARVE